MNYQLNIYIDIDSLRAIQRAKYWITLARKMQQGNTNMIWLSVDPFEFTHISMEDEFGLYGAPLEALKPGTRISTFSSLSLAVPSKEYIFSDNAFLGPFPNTLVSPPNPYTFSLKNESPLNKYPILAFGLSQSAIINGGPLLNYKIGANLIPSFQNFAFLPSSDLYLWLQGDFSSGTLISGIPEQAILVSFSDEQAEKYVEYNPNTGRFFEVGAPIEGSLF